MTLSLREARKRYLIDAEFHARVDLAVETIKAEAREYGCKLEKWNIELVYLAASAGNLASECTLAGLRLTHDTD